MFAEHPIAGTRIAWGKIMFFPLPIRKALPFIALFPTSLTLCAAQRAQAQESCSLLSRPVVVPGTTDVKPFLARVAPQLAGASGSDQTTVIYQAVGSCTAIESVLSEGRLQGTAIYWTPEGEEQSCQIEEDTRGDLALSDVTVQTCTGEKLPSGFGEFPSMIQTFGFVVPPTSTQEAITAEEAYYLFQYGGEAERQVNPWSKPSSIIIRNPSSSTQLLIGLEAGVPGTQWSANLTEDAGGSSAVIARVAAETSTGNAENTIGILSAQKYDEVRDEVKMLAFEADGQECLGAVYPDSTPTSFDKQNVRDGHYTIWGYLWGIGALDSEGELENPAAKHLIDFITGAVTVGDVDPIAETALAGAVPECAMRVKRDYDGAPLQSYQPNKPCGCYYESVVSGETSCDTCNNDDDCGSDSDCLYGYCEVN